MAEEFLELQDMIEEFSPVSPNYSDITDWDTDDIDDSLLLEAVEGMSTSVDDDDCVITGVEMPSTLSVASDATNISDTTTEGASSPTSSSLTEVIQAHIEWRRGGGGKSNMRSST
ncbi:uncharacterized protein LOC124265371 isoform X2 [Haliotis rubra]|uniref:uncharacterized protein LOC124265371 isoform X2 n=1 Tax=Haliotis rubra TaxID=36100 RepID=UPI001EE6040D|nr:uncharacterized protein LOC124265371 isoform X2 [Haliotis rubra]